MAMTSYERYIAVCELRKPDRVPVSPLIMTFAAKLAGIPYREYCLYGEKMAEAQLVSIRRFGYDSVNVTADAMREAEAIGAPVFWQDDEVPGPVPDSSLIQTVDDLEATASARSAWQQPNARTDQSAPDSAPRTGR